VASRAVLQWIPQSLTPHGTVMERKNNQHQGESAITGQPEWEKPQEMENRILLGIRKVTAMRQLQADHPCKQKATKPKVYPKLWR